MKRKFLIAILILLVPSIAFAANPCSKEDVGTGSLARCITQIYTWSIVVAAILAVLMVTLGGYLYMTAGGNAEQSTKGKDFIWQALAGLGILFLSYIILATINPDLVNFNDPFNRLNQSTNQTQTQQANPTSQPPRGGGG